MPTIFEEEDEQLRLALTEHLNNVNLPTKPMDQTMEDVTAIDPSMLDMSNGMMTNAPFSPAVENLSFPTSAADNTPTFTDPTFGALDDFSDLTSPLPEPTLPCDYCSLNGLYCTYSLVDLNVCTSCAVVGNGMACNVNQNSPGLLNSPNDPLDTTGYPEILQEGLFDQNSIPITSMTPDNDILPRQRASIPEFKVPGRPASASFITKEEMISNSERKGTRFSRAVIKVLRDWLSDHSDSPYPDSDEKAHLRHITGLSDVQIANWLANARRRSKPPQSRGSKNHRSGSPMPGAPTEAIPIARAKSVTSEEWQTMNPLDRWKHSPPENEPAYIENIANAVEASRNDPFYARDEDDNEAIRSGKNSRNGNRTPPSRKAPSSRRSAVRAPTISSQQTQTRSTGSKETQETAYSHGTSLSFGSFQSLSRRGRARRKNVPGKGVTKSTAGPRKRVFQCTFCTDAFASKYDWTRHEKSLHLNLEKFVCCPFGPVVTNQQSGQKCCAYCNHPDPDHAHLETHNHSGCASKSVESRTFYRKDHLRQHLRLMHNTPLTTVHANWRSTLDDINCRCGFCHATFTTWSSRVDHLARHFRSGAQMADWKGCRGLDPSVAALVTNAMPPYLIGWEARSLLPFSATNQECQFSGIGTTGVRMETQEHFQQYPDCPSPRNVEAPTWWEILTVRLGKWAMQRVKEGHPPTDEELQAEGRRIEYGDDDPWNQSAADNEHWLELFKRAHGLDILRAKASAAESSTPIDKSIDVANWTDADCSRWGDLGIRGPYRPLQQSPSDNTDLRLTGNGTTALGALFDKNSTADVALDNNTTTALKRCPYNQDIRGQETGIAHNAFGLCDMNDAQVAWCMLTGVGTGGSHSLRQHIKDTQEMARETPWALQEGEQAGAGDTPMEMGDLDFENLFDADAAAGVRLDEAKWLNETCLRREQADARIQAIGKD